jgi:hypothetical protein
MQPPADHGRALLRVLSFNVRFHEHDHLAAPLAIACCASGGGS